MSNIEKLQSALEKVVSKISDNRSYIAKILCMNENAAYKIKSIRKFILENHASGSITNSYDEYEYFIKVAEKNSQVSESDLIIIKDLADRINKKLDIDRIFFEDIGKIIKSEKKEEEKIFEIENLII